MTDIQHTLVALTTALQLLSSLVAKAPTATYDIAVPQIQQAEAAVIETVQLPTELRRALGCESSWEATPEGEPQQYNKNGTLRTHKNENGTIDYGAAMINSSNGWLAKKYGLTNYKTDLNENLKLALHVYELQGLGAWYAYNPVTRLCVWQKQYNK